MGKDTSIQWADSSLNPSMGCSGCELWNSKVRKCYAGRQTAGRAGFPGWPTSFGEPTLFLDRIANGVKWKDLSGCDRPEKPWLNGLPRIIFLNDMGDTFDAKLPLNWMAPLLPLMAATPHQWLILTKRPSRFVEFSKAHPLPPNVWPGTSVTTQATTKRVEQLRGVVGGGPKFVSFEPLWESPLPEAFDGIQWAIFGFESGDDDETTTPGDIQWIEDGASYARSLKIPAFIKQLGRLPYQTGTHGEPEPFLDPDPHHGDWSLWPDHLCVREMPTLTPTTLL